MSRRLPPLNSLRAFEAAARHLSLKKAAGELHVTPAAVSHQVRTLEEYCAKPLFHRLARALRLTEAGQAALPLLREGFDKLAEAAEAMRAEERVGILTVSVAPSFGAKWLIPRLDRFHAAHPEFDVRIDATDALVTFAGDGVDVALRYGRGTYRNLRSECLMSEVSLPVCSPRLLERDPPLRRPDDLRHHTLLHVQWKMEDDAAPNWRMWLRAAGVEGVDAERGPRFSVEGMALEAAIAGQGVALAGAALVEGDLKTGRLVRPFPPSLSQATAFSYYVVYPEAKAGDPRVMAFRDWVLAEVARDDNAAVLPT
ncbi:MAG: transcriptional regulator GcvA [Proteobacteria bacterium]|nr:transcriptional regulator GcvA [Pseudomonadota bacterium]